MLCFAKNRAVFNANLLPRTEKQNISYKNKDNDPKGAWKPTPLHARSGNDSNIYTIEFPNGISWTAPKGRYPRYSKENLLKLYNNGELYFNANGGVDKKTYLSEVRNGISCGTLWHYDNFGHTHSNNEELAAKIKEHQEMTNQQAIENANLRKEMWKNRSQVLPRYKSPVLQIIENEELQKEEERKKTIERKELMSNEVKHLIETKIPVKKIDPEQKKRRENLLSP